MKPQKEPGEGKNYEKGVKKKYLSILFWVIWETLHSLTKNTKV